MNQLPRYTHPSRQTNRLLLMNGWSPEQAGNLVARLDGLSATQHWTMRQVQQIEFIRWLVATGRIGGDGA